MPNDVNPEELLYAETHEWLRLADEDGQKVATIGISAFAVEQLTDLVFMELPDVGSQVEAQSEFGEVESVKAVSPLYSPVSGEIIAVNEQVVVSDERPDALELLGQDPFGDGWLIKIKVTDESGLSTLLDYATYQKQCAEAG